jgi:hypothetical protein
VPLVDLAHAESEFLGDVEYKVSLPLGILFELVFENPQLLLVLALATLDVAGQGVVVLGLLQQGFNALIQVV